MFDFIKTWYWKRKYAIDCTKKIKIDSANVYTSGYVEVRNEDKKIKYTPQSKIFKFWKWVGILFFPFCVYLFFHEAFTLLPLFIFLYLAVLFLCGLFTFLFALMANLVEEVNIFNKLKFESGALDYKTYFVPLSISLKYDKAINKDRKNMTNIKTNKIKKLYDKEFREEQIVKNWRKT